ncbi:MAG: hypothetical protein K9J30_10975 [Bacteroidales bacterium]|nr:hypothetical protein [Bacteroidales bacterium]
MKSISKKLFAMMFVAVTLVSGCNEPSDPTMNVMAMGEWYLSDLFVNNQVVNTFSSDFVLDLEQNQTVIFVNHDGIGLTGTWDIDDAGTTLTLTPDLGEGAEPVVFEVLYLLIDKMGIRRTVTSDLLGTTAFTYILEK